MKTLLQSEKLQSPDIYSKFIEQNNQYRTNNSGDFVVRPATVVTALLLINLRQA
jgi:hypothetical protein